MMTNIMTPILKFIGFLYFTTFLFFFNCITCLVFLTSAHYSIFYMAKQCDSCIKNSFTGKNKQKDDIKGDIFMKTNWLDYTLLTLVIIGAINWGLIGFFRFDLVAFLFGNLSWLSRIVYALVGIGGLYTISLYGRIKSGDEA